MKPITKTRTLIRAAKKANELEKRYKANERLIKRLQKENDVLGYNMSLCKRVSRVVDGVPLSFGPRGISRIEEVGEHITHPRAEFYPNATDKNLWGLRLYTRKHAHAFTDEKFRGANWPDRESVEKAALAWVLRGEIVEHPLETVRHVMES